MLRDKVHFFGHFEYEREPRVSIWNTPFPAFNVEPEGNDSVKLGGGRFDYQLSPGVHLMGKTSYAKKFQPFGVGGINHPAETGSQADVNQEYLGQMTQVLSNRAVNEIKGGFAKYYFDQLNLTTWSNHWQASTQSVQKRQRPRSICTDSPPVIAWVGQLSAHALQPDRHRRASISGRPRNRAGSSGGGPSGNGIVR